MFIDLLSAFSRKLSKMQMLMSDKCQPTAHSDFEEPYMKVAGAATGVQADCPLVLASLLSAKDWVQAGLACSI